MAGKSKATNSKGGEGARAETAARTEEIMRGAAAVFSRVGFAAASMREVAKSAKASLGSIYYHFENKEAILHAIICGNFRRVLESADQALAGVADPRKALELFVVNHISFFAQHLDEMRVMSHELDTLTGEAGAEEAGLRRNYAARVRTLLEALRPDLDSDELRVATLSLFGMMNWTYRWYETLPRGTRPEDLGREMAALFLDGFLGGAKGKGKKAAAPTRKR